MNAEASLSEVVDAAAECIKDGERHSDISPHEPLPSGLKPGDGKPSLELFHFVFSVCSQKVRMVLAEKEANWRSHETVIFPPIYDNYCADYARLRSYGKSSEERLAVSYSGVTSVEQEGFDPLVVPTLVDHTTGAVVTDSKQICLHLCQKIETGTELLPPEHEAAILRQLDKVDRTPHAALLYGANPDGDSRPSGMVSDMDGIHAVKIDFLRQRMETADASMRRLYQAKIAKEQAAADFVNDVTQMRSAIVASDEIIAGLSNDLRAGDDWLVGDTFTLADVFWAISLYRLKWLGYDWLWSSKPEGTRIAAYLDRLMLRDSFRKSVTSWPGHP